MKKSRKRLIAFLTTIFIGSSLAIGYMVIEHQHELEFLNLVTTIKNHQNNRDILRYTSKYLTEQDDDFIYQYEWVEEKVWVPGSNGTLPVNYILSKFKPSTPEQSLAYELVGMYQKAANNEYREYPHPISAGMLSAIHSLESNFATFLDGRYQQGSNGVDDNAMTLANFTHVEHEKVGRAPSKTLYVNNGGSDNHIDGPFQIENVQSRIDKSGEIASQVRSPLHPEEKTFDVYYMPDSFLGMIQEIKSIPTGALDSLNEKARLAILAATYNRGTITQQLWGFPYNGGGTKGKVSNTITDDILKEFQKNYIDMAESLLPAYGIDFNSSNRNDASSLMFLVAMKNGWMIDEKSFEDIYDSKRMISDRGVEYFNAIFPEAAGNDIVEFIRRNFVRNLDEATGYSKSEVKRIYNYDDYMQTYGHGALYRVTDTTSSNYINKLDNGQDPKIVMAFDIVNWEYMSMIYLSSDATLLNRLLAAGCPETIDGVAMTYDNLPQIRSLGGQGGEGYYITTKKKVLVSKIPRNTDTSQAVVPQNITDTSQLAQNFEYMLTWLDNPPTGETKLALFKTYAESTGTPYYQSTDGGAGMKISLETAETIFELSNGKSMYEKKHGHTFKNYLMKKDGTPVTEGTTNAELRWYNKRVADCVVLAHIYRNKGYVEDREDGTANIQGYLHSKATVDLWREAYSNNEDRIAKYTSKFQETGEFDSSVKVYYSGAKTIDSKDERIRPGDIFVAYGHGWIIFGRASADGAFDASMTNTGNEVTFKKGDLIRLESGSNLSGIKKNRTESGAYGVSARPVWSDYISELP